MPPYWPVSLSEVPVLDVARHGGHLSIRINAPPVRVHATLAIYHDDLDPKVISGMLGIEPTTAHRRGETGSRGKIPRTIGAWLLRSDSMRNGKHRSAPNSHIDWILDQIANRHGAIRSLLENDFRVEIHCRFGIAHWNTTCDLEPQIVRRLASFNIPLVFDIYDEQDS